MQPRTVSASTALVRDTKHFQMEAFKESLLENLNSIENDCILNPNVNMREFINNFTNALNNHAPLRKQTRKEKRFETKPWLTKDSLISIKHKN